METFKKPRLGNLFGFQSLGRPLAFGLALAAVVAGISFLCPNYYRSEALILPNDSKAGGLGQISAAAAAFGLNVPGQDGMEANFTDILGSRWLRTKLLDTTFSFQVPGQIFRPGHPRTETLRSFLHAKNEDQAIRNLDSMIYCSRHIKTRILTVAAETPSPQLSQGIVKRSLELLEDFLQTKGRTKGSAKAIFATQRLADVEKDYMDSEFAFRKFIENNRNYASSPDPDTKVIGMRLEANLRIQQQLVASVVMNREQALMEEKNDIPILNIMDDASLPLDKSWPRRSLWVTLAFLGGFVGAFFIQHRKMIVAMLAPLPSQELSDVSGRG